MDMRPHKKGQDTRCYMQADIGVVSINEKRTEDRLK